MARTLKILQVNASVGATPGSVEVAGDYTSVFRGKLHRTAAGVESPFYTTPVPAGSSLVPATQFEITGNAKYSGRYTVYTPTGVGDLASSTYSAGVTTIRVAEPVPVLAVGDAPTLASDGDVTGISTYLLATADGAIIVPPGVTIADRPVDLFGQNTRGWGEGYAQNFVDLAQNFAGSTAPAAPFTGQAWYDTTGHPGTLKLWSGDAWVAVVSSRRLGPLTGTTWVVTHGLGLPSPYIADVSFFVQRGLSMKMILPQDVSFDTPNQLTVTFTNVETGYVMVRG